MNEPLKIHCHDACGQVLIVKDELDLQGSGWQYLQITRSYRCPTCWRSLRDASTLVGTSGETADALPPSSIGAIKKSTAETILPPSLKG